MRVDSCPAIRAATSRSPPFRRYSGDPGPGEAVRADLGRQPRLSGAALDHLERVHTRHGLVLEHIAAPGLAAPEEWAAAVLADSGGLEVAVDVALSDVVGGDDVVPPTLFVKPEERARSLGCSSRRREARLRRSPARSCRRGPRGTRGCVDPRGSRRRCRRAAPGLAVRPERSGSDRRSGRIRAPWTT